MIAAGGRSDGARGGSHCGARARRCGAHGQQSLRHGERRPAATTGLGSQQVEACLWGDGWLLRHARGDSTRSVAGTSPPRIALGREPAAQLQLNQLIKIWNQIFWGDHIVSSNSVTTLERAGESRASPGTRERPEQRGKRRHVGQSSVADAGRQERRPGRWSGGRSALSRRGRLGKLAPVWAMQGALALDMACVVDGGSITGAGGAGRGLYARGTRVLVRIQR